MSKRRFGDRKDGKLIRDIDVLHFAMANACPHRTDNEIYFNVDLDLSNIIKFLEQKNSNNQNQRYTFFHVGVTIALKVIMLRPQLNRFIANKNFYQRNDVSASFTIKKTFADKGVERLTIIKGDPSDNIDTVHTKILNDVGDLRSHNDATSAEGAMSLIKKFPLSVSKGVFNILRFLDRHGKLPASIPNGDSNYASIMMANLGSIQLPAVYHHLFNWGTCSIMCVIGEKTLKPRFDECGKVTMYPAIPVGLTVDERITDGYYLSKTVKLIKKLVENPELLELPLNTDVEY